MGRKTMGTSMRFGRSAAIVTGADFIKEAEKLARRRFGRSGRIFVQRETGTKTMGGIFSVFRTVRAGGATRIGQVHV